ncbi:MOP flippase family protein [Povalibacter sp.]|uniref:MOP flippase family protein n=1 Tax=Povalibacter sp. TaxID=1962978 RepID=UPI002F3FBD97
MSAVNNARWIAAAQAAKIALQFISVAVLARLLTPDDYGLIAMVWVVGNLATLLRDMGTAAAIVQEPNLTDETTNAVYWFNVVVGATLCVGLIALSYPIAGLFRTDAVMPLLYTLAPTFFISSLGSVHRALLERKSAFRVVAAVEVTTSIFGLIVTIGAAWAGAGAMSFVWGMLSMSAVSTAAFWNRARWMPSRIAGSSRFGAVLRFSGHLSAFNLINYFARNADAMVIGRYLGAASLGIYSTAYKVMLFPLQNMTFVANRALFPVMCRFESTAEMRSLYLKSVSVIVMLTAPLMMGVFVLREPFIHVFLGARWHAAADVLIWLAPVGFVQSIVSTTGTVSMVRGRTDQLMVVGLFVAALQVASFFIGVQWGVLGVAAAYLVANLLGAIPSLWVALRLLDAEFSDLLREIWSACLCALLMGFGVWAMGKWVLPESFSEILQLLAGIAVGVSIYGSLMLVLFPARVRLAFTLVPTIRLRGAKP